MPKRSVLLLWFGAFILTFTIVAALWQPMLRAWRCVESAATGERVAGRVVRFEVGSGMVIALPEQASGSATCVVRGEVHQFSNADPGRAVEVFHVLDQPGRCEFVATVEAAQALLRVLASGTTVLILLILLLVIRLQRSALRPARLTARFDLDRLQRVETFDEARQRQVRGVACPQCEKPMREGMLPLLAGMNWRDLEEPMGFPNALTGLSGTTVWRGRPVLHAYRCDPCEILLMKHGRSDAEPPSPGDATTPK